MKHQPGSAIKQTKLRRGYSTGIMRESDHESMQQHVLRMRGLDPARKPVGKILPSEIAFGF